MLELILFHIRNENICMVALLCQICIYKANPRGSVQNGLSWLQRCWWFNTASCRKTLK